MDLNLSNLESVILSYLKKNYLPKRFKRWRDEPFNMKDLEIYAPSVGELSDAFTVERGNLPAHYFNRPEFRSAYLIYFLLINAAKLKFLFERLLNNKMIFDQRPLKILDVGCGPATGALAATIAFSNRSIEIFGLEQDEKILNDGSEIFNNIKKTNHFFRPISGLIEKGRGFDLVRKNAPYDLIIAANLFNEFKTEEHRSSVAMKLIKNLSDEGLFIIVDPALRKTTREMMELRDKIIQNDEGVVIDPCPHQMECPMLKANSRDWCHAYVEWSPPKVIRELDKILGIKHDYLKMAYLVIAKNIGEMQIPLTPFNKGGGGAGGFFCRVVSSQLRSKGKIELLLCSGNGSMRRAVRLDKDASECNSGFDRLKRYDLIEYRSDSGKISKSDKIQIVEKFNR